MRPGAIGSDWRNWCDGCKSPGKCTECFHCVQKYLCVYLNDPVYGTEGDLILKWSCGIAPGKPTITEKWQGYYSGLLRYGDSDVDILLYYRKVDGVCAYVIESAVLGYDEESPLVYPIYGIEENCDPILLDGMLLDIPDFGVVRIVIGPYGTDIKWNCGEDCHFCDCACATLCAIYSDGTDATAQLIHYDCNSRAWVGEGVIVYLESAGGCRIRAEVDGEPIGEAVFIDEVSECLDLYGAFVEINELEETVRYLTVSCTRCAGDCRIVHTDCCPEALPKVLFAVITFGPIFGCTDFAPIVVPIIYDPVFGGWRWLGFPIERFCDRPDADPYGYPQGDCRFVLNSLDLTCSGGLMINGELNMLSDYVWDCGPFEAVFSNVFLPIEGEIETCGTGTVTILESAP